MPMIYVELGGKLTPRRFWDGLMCIVNVNVVLFFLKDDKNDIMQVLVFNTSCKQMAVCLKN